MQNDIGQRVTIGLWQIDYALLQVEQAIRFVLYFACFGKAKPSIVCDQVLSEKVVEKIFDKTTQHVYVNDLAEIGRLMTLDQALFELLDLRIGAVHSVQTDLVSEQTSRFDFVYDRLQYGGHIWRRVIEIHVITNGALRLKVKRAKAWSLQQIFAFVVHNQLALFALHDHFAEFGSLVTMST
jgi:hypothetical protein